jgi:phytoene dehydrogenase-like protein
VERHEAIVAGAGPAGLAAAALLSKRGFETLVLERTDAVGARWRTRYDGLRLNTMRTFSTLPGYRIPRRYGRYPRREDFVAYLEAYAAHHRLPLRFATALHRVERAEEDGLWRLETSSGPLLARYAVLAMGYDAVPKLRGRTATGSPASSSTPPSTARQDPTSGARCWWSVPETPASTSPASWSKRVPASASRCGRRPTCSRATGTAFRSSHPRSPRNTCRQVR